MSLRAILFDKDGTLLDLDGTWVPAYRRAAEHLETVTATPGLALRLLTATGYDAANDRLLPASLLYCGSNGQIVEAWASDPAVPPADTIRDTVLGIFHDQAVNHAAPVTDLGELFGTLRARGFVLGVATMDGEAAARATIASLGIGDDLAFVCGFDSGYGIKPGPGMAEAFIAEVGVAPEDVVMVGDAVKDLQMGLAAGCGLRVGVLTGAADRAELAPHADHVLASIATLPEVL